jgi:hypothetical protein
MNTAETSEGGGYNRRRFLRDAALAVGSNHFVLKTKQQMKGDRYDCN